MGLRKGTLRADGGSRGNPGPAGIGFILLDDSGNPVYRGGRFIGQATNNVAEYEALLWGMEVALAAQMGDILIELDSELVVKQLLGQYRVRNANLKPLHQRAMTLLKRFSRVSVAHIPRSSNTQADALANEAMDMKSQVGDAPYPVEEVWPGRLF